MNKIKRQIAATLLTVMTLQSAAPLIAATMATKVPAGTLVRLRASGTVTGSNSSVGNTVIFTVTNDVKVDGAVVIKAGANAIGTVSSVRKAGIIGSAGSVGVSLTSVTAVDGTEIPISASAVREGEDKQITALIIGLLCLVGFFMKGGEGELQAGSTLEARTISEATITT